MKTNFVMFGPMHLFIESLKNVRAKCLPRQFIQKDHIEQSVTEWWNMREREKEKCLEKCALKHLIFACHQQHETRAINRNCKCARTPNEQMGNESHEHAFIYCRCVLLFLLSSYLGGSEHFRITKNHADVQYVRWIMSCKIRHCNVPLPAVTQTKLSYLCIRMMQCNFIQNVILCILCNYST